MPFSGVDCILPVVNTIYFKCPTWQSHLDIGTGWGQWGTILRAYFDYPTGFSKRTKRIVGIEGFADYRNPAWQMYDVVVIGDAYDIMKANAASNRYDLCTMIEVLEHFEKSKGIEMLKLLKRHCNHLIFSYTNSEQGAAFDNEFERHRSQWGDKDVLDLFPGAIEIYKTEVGKFWYAGPNC